jgi:formate hydrogenlyase transcriptional activator
VPAASMKKLSRWHWPGNIRELENLIERAVILTRGSALEVPVSDLGNGSAEKALTRMPDSGQREQLVRILRETRGRVGGSDGAAARLGLKRTTLISRMKKLGIDPRAVS